MPDPRNDHGSGVQPVGEYAPGGRAVNPFATSKGVSVLREAPIPVPPAGTDRSEPQPPRKRGRPMGVPNRPPIPQEMFDAPPDEG